MTDHLLVKATERIAYGWLDKRCIESMNWQLDGSIHWRGCGEWLFPFEAEIRGYCMAAWKEHHSTRHGYYCPNTGAKLK